MVDHYAATPEVLAIGQIFNSLDRDDCLVSYPSWNRFIRDSTSTEVFTEIVQPAWKLQGKSIVFCEATARTIRVNKKDFLDVHLTLSQVTRGFSQLEAKKIIQKCPPMTGAEVVSLLSQKTPQHVGSGKKCNWCKGTTHILQQHHYPVPRKDGGDKVVSICPNCHYEFHYLIRENFYQLTDVGIKLCAEAESERDRSYCGDECDPYDFL